MQEEDRERGTVAKTVWLRYAAALGWWNVAFGLMGMYGVSQALQYGSSFWLGIWAEHPDASPWFYIEVYCASRRVAVCILIRSIITAYASVAAGRKIQRRALQAVVASPMAFSTRRRSAASSTASPSTCRRSTCSSRDGLAVRRLLRLADVHGDHHLPRLAVGARDDPAALGFYLMYASYYRNTAREVQRLDSISKSPIYAAFTEALNGATSSRPTAPTTASRRSTAQGDYNMRANFISLAANRWLTVRLEFFSNLLLAFTALLAVVSAIYDSGGQAGVRATLAGLALTYAPGLTDNLSFLIRQFTVLETQMVSVERLLGYSKLEGEAPSARRTCCRRAAQGAIEFRDVVMGYRAGLPDVLKDEPRDRAEREDRIVGRTGAGRVDRRALPHLRAARGRDLDRRRRHLDGRPADAARSPRNHPAGPGPFHGHAPLEVDPTGKYTDAELWGALGRAGWRPRWRSTPRTRPADGGEGRQPLDGPAPAALPVPRAAAERAHSRPGRGDRVGGHGERGAHSAHARERARRDDRLTIAHRLETIYTVTGSS